MPYVTLHYTALPLHYCLQCTAPALQCYYCYLLTADDVVGVVVAAYASSAGPVLGPTTY
jgi:hypothetical protein